MAIELEQIVRVSLRRHRDLVSFGSGMLMALSWVFVEGL